MDIPPPDASDLNNEYNLDVDIPPVDPSDLDNEYNHDLNVPQLDTSMYGAVTSDPQTATESVTNGDNEDTPEPGNVVATIDLPHCYIRGEPSV